MGRSRHTTREVDVTALRWLFLDIDPVGPPEISSTGDKLAAIARVMTSWVESWILLALRFGAAPATEPGFWSGCPIIPTIRRTAPRGTDHQVDLR